MKKNEWQDNNDDRMSLEMQSSLMVSTGGNSHELKTNEKFQSSTVPMLGFNSNSEHNLINNHSSSPLQLPILLSHTTSISPKSPRKVFPQATNNLMIGNHSTTEYIPKSPKKISKASKHLPRVNSIFKYIQGELDLNSRMASLHKSPVKTPLSANQLFGEALMTSSSNRTTDLLPNTTLTPSSTPGTTKVSESSHLKEEKSNLNKLTYGEELRRSIYNFIEVPFMLEQYLFFGFFICFDSLLFHFTFFPLRIIFALIGLLTRGITKLSNSSVCDLLKLLALAVNVYIVFITTDYSLLYHAIRGESVLKLFMLYNMLEIFDRLCSAYGQDSIVSMMFTATDPKFKAQNDSSEKRKLIFNAVFSFVSHLVYLYIHTMVSLLRIITLNIALNSRNQSLLTLLISTNFVELKASIFKKSVKEALFQLSCTDIVERFEMVVFSVVIFFQNSLYSGEYEIEEFVQIIFTIISSEMIADSIKHAFICKFNKINCENYDDYILKLSSDLTSMTHFDSFLDNTNIVARRVGFVEGPIICVILRMVLESMERSWEFFSSDHTVIWTLVTILLTYGCLFLLKVLISILVVGHAAKRITNNREKQIQLHSK